MGIVVDEVDPGGRAPTLEPAGNATEGGRAQNRRVEIKIAPLTQG